MIELKDFRRYHVELSFSDYEIGFIGVSFGWFSVTMNSISSTQEEDELRWLIRHGTSDGMETMNGG
jgi:hypothetical protein